MNTALDMVRSHWTRTEWWAWVVYIDMVKRDASK
jgi:hypothetical protein